MTINLSEAIEEYRTRKSKNNESDLEKIESCRIYFEGLVFFPDAIKRASEAIDPHEKMYQHQWHLGKQICVKGTNALLKHENELKDCKSFEDIFKITEKVRLKTHGLGNLWSYDTALRIGFNLRLYPLQVYIQSGVKKGVKKLPDGNKFKGRNHQLSDFPKELLKLKKRYLIENFLCIYGKD